MYAISEMYGVTIQYDRSNACKTIMYSTSVIHSKKLLCPIVNSIPKSLLIIVAGHRNLIDVTAVKVDAAKSLRDLSLEQRRCKFSDEIQNLTLHKKYSQSNCFLVSTLRNFSSSSQSLLTNKLACLSLAGMIESRDSQRI